MRAPLAAALFSLAILPALASRSPAGDDAGWKDHMGDIPFIVGRDAGEKEREFTGKPSLVFYTAHG